MLNNFRKISLYLCNGWTEPPETGTIWKDSVRSLKYRKGVYKKMFASANGIHPVG
jgi:hypothetical protein